MLLAIDSGNTNIVFALFDHDGTLRGEWRGTSKAERTADEMGVWLWQLMAMENIDRQQVSAAIIASVVPAMSFNLKTLCRRYFSCEPVIIGEPGVDLGLDIRVDHPAEVGADRLVNAIAAHQSYGGPLIVIDFGTATTFDVIDGDGAYRGGAIAPGVNLSVEALHMAAAKLPRVGVGRPERVIGVNTIEAMRSGVFWGYVGMIEGLIARIKKEFGAEMKVIATGGLASLFDEATAVIEQADVDLTLRGLWTVYTRNQGQAA